jgi:peptide methionine sulfoxide reductase msrA/msrB
MLASQAVSADTGFHAAGKKNVQKATFAGGCFRCIKNPFEELEGVLSVTSGYTGGSTSNPPCENYGGGEHIEAVEIAYDPGKISHEKLLEVFWHQVYPTDAEGQFTDRGREYTAAIYYDDE